MGLIDPTSMKIGFNESNISWLLMCVITAEKDLVHKHFINLLPCLIIFLTREYPVYCKKYINIIFLIILITSILPQVHMDEINTLGPSSYTGMRSTLPWLY